MAYTYEKVYEMYEGMSIEKDIAKDFADTLNSRDRLRTTITEQHAEIEKLSKDAARYRFVRRFNPRFEFRYWNGEYWNPMFEDEADLTIDSSMEKETG